MVCLSDEVAQSSADHVTVHWDEIEDNSGEDES